MINPSEFCKFLKKNNIDFYVGVPDSLMKVFVIIYTLTLKIIIYQLMKVQHCLLQVVII